jgi:hypothetical protein
MAMLIGQRVKHFLYAQPALQPFYALSTGFTIARQQAVYIFNIIPARHLKGYLFFQAFHFFTLHAPEMEMVVVMVLVMAIVAQCVVIFSVVTYYFMHQPIFAKAVQHPVHGYPVHSTIYFTFYILLAQCSSS